MTNVRTGSLVRYKDDTYRVISICTGECSHREERGRFLVIEQIDGN